MKIDLSEFHDEGIAGLSSNSLGKSGGRWGWVGAVNRENVAECQTFVDRIKNGNFEAAVRFQDVGKNLIFAIAQVTDGAVLVALFEKTNELVSPILLETCTFPNQGLRVVPAELCQFDELLQSTRLSWKEALAAIIRSFRT